jgi:hypothetical protein
MSKRVNQGRDCVGREAEQEVKRAKKGAGCCIWLLPELSYLDQVVPRTRHNGQVGTGQGAQPITPGQSL